MIQKICIIVCFLLAFGCATPKHSWPDHDRGLVWTAMVAAAEAPEYESDDPRRRWIVTENNVDENADLGRIRVHRLLARSLKLPRQVSQTDHRKWLFEIMLLPTDPPTATFHVLNAGLIPVRVTDEAEQYFSLVDKMLHPPIQ